jgi:serine protease Do
MVSGITEGGPAARGGLRPGDIVITYDGKPINEDRYLTRYVADTPIGKNVKIDLLRDGKKQTVSVVIARLDERTTVARTSTSPDTPDVPQPGSRNVSGRIMGMTLAEMNGEMRRRFSIEADVKGLVVTSVDSGSDATGKVQPGDVVVEMAFEPVETIGEAQALAMRAERRPGAAVLLYINRNGDMTFRSVKPRKG